MNHDHIIEQPLAYGVGQIATITELSERDGRLHITTRYGDLVLSDDHPLTSTFDGQTRDDLILEIVRGELDFIQRAARIARDPFAFHLDFVPDAEHPLEVVRDRDEAQAIVAKLSTTLERERAAHAQLEAGYLDEIAHLHRRIATLDRSDDDEVDFLVHFIESDAGRTPTRQ